MIATVLVTAAIAAIAMLPGLLLLREGRPQVGQWSAAATASLVVTMLATALLGELSDVAGLGQLPAATLVPVSLAAALAAWWHTRRCSWASEPLEWHGAALAAAFVGFGLFSLALAVEPTDGGGLLIHAWYNADWFKHLGHVHALADYGVPARDVFGNGGPLYYYWLSYILPGAGAALGGDGWAALATANAIITALFCFTFYGAARMTGASRTVALAVTFLGLFVTAPPGFFTQMLFGPGLEALMQMPQAPKGPALLALAQFIPQHTLVAAMLLAWALIHRPDSTAPTSARLLALVSLASAMAVSTLLGATLLAAYGLTVLWQRGLRGVPELAVMVVASGLLVLVLGVLQLGNPDSALESPLLANRPDPDPWFVRGGSGIVLLFTMTGIPLLAAIFLVRFWKPAAEPERFTRALGVCLIAAAFACVVLTQVGTPARIAVEVLIRAVIPAGIGVAIIAAWAIGQIAVRPTTERRLAWAAVAAMVLVSLPCVYVRTVWMTRFDDDYTTLIPADDRRVLAYLRANSGARDTVWQYPEPPILSETRGHDAWAPVMAGRTVLNSQRATDYAQIRPFVEASERFFAGRPAEIPSAADWVYLSRILHPDSYEVLATRMKADPAWRQRACYADACLFDRARRVAAK
jgi:hypothetical protein